LKPVFLLFLDFESKAISRNINNSGVKTNLSKKIILNKFDENRIDGILE